MSSKLTVATLINQRLSHYCGPAVAQMVLQCTPAAPVSQDDLWEAVMAATSGQGAPNTNPPPAGAITGFEKQKCVACQGGQRCWFSTPEALLKVINAELLGALAAPTPSNALEVIKMASANENNAIARLVKSVDKGIAPAFLKGGDHWCVVKGYEFGNPTAAYPATTFGGVSVVGFYVLTPTFVTNAATAQLPPLTLTSVAAFKEDFAVVECGSTFRSKLVAIVKKP